MYCIKFIGQDLAEVYGDNPQDCIIKYLASLNTFINKVYYAQDDSIYIRKSEGTILVLRWMDCNTINVEFIPY